MVALAIDIPTSAIQQFCRRHHVRKLSIFGSALRATGEGAFRPSSDVDLLIEFAPDHTPGFALIDMQDELSALLGQRPIDLLTPKSLNRRIRNSILHAAVVLYEK